MTGYVIQRRADGAFVARPGSRRSYTRRLETAQVFTDREAAQRDLCVENERVVAVIHNGGVAVAGA